MFDFTSALYLGLRHPSPSLLPWMGLTTGKPAALEPPPGSVATAGNFAALVGCERATPLASTLHLFWDLFGWLARDRVRIYMDSGTYAVAKWGVERVAARGVAVRTFAHHDVAGLRALLQGDLRANDRAIVVADGFCPNCGRPAPIGEFLQCVEPRGGYVVLDDTQALGVLGTLGGGSLRWHGIRSPDVIVGSSLAKGFGAPMAMLAGNADVIRQFEEQSQTRIHCSPPSLAALHAADHALSINRVQGDRLRHRLAQLIRRFQAGLASIGLAADGGLFPVQTVRPSGLSAESLHQRLRHAGIQTVLMRHCRDISLRVAFLITALHRHSDIDYAVSQIARAISRAYSTHQPTGRVS
ncbi:aminotransferase class I/II-fold pyridoxal phosphate-dependent enzyme [Bradyrhizobium sp. Ai1a-2]|uniref:aminotransferase class I/II-fold pyridoxal phosphate-dependent enzyme n=1 Tax=Bradyrhizobium sp. Ai1a-2 TaxID=196490 RepID=UPI000400F217|nr:aminotransferase class I/II-fold pyridoxal phosphate-dependent enzyme [Bradyrhizobium sp. Ai1a-2]